MVINKKSCSIVGNKIGNSHSLTDCAAVLKVSREPTTPVHPLSQLPTSSLLPDFHATEPQVGGQPTPVIARDAVRFQQHLQLLKEFWGQPGVGEVGFSEDQRNPVCSTHIPNGVHALQEPGIGERIPNIPPPVAQATPPHLLHGGG